MCVSINQRGLSHREIRHVIRDALDKVKFVEGVGKQLIALAHFARNEHHDRNVKSEHWNLH